MTLAFEPDCRVGIDLVEIAEVAEAADRFGDRYLSRLFTQHERASSAGPPEVRFASLAARFAAKEATVKVLRPESVRPDWRSIEVFRQPNGACDLRLSDTAATLARAADLRSMSVSLTHHGGLAAAVVIALTGPRSERSDPGELEPMTALAGEVARIHHERERE